MDGWEFERVTREYAEALHRARTACSQDTRHRLLAIEAALIVADGTGARFVHEELIRARALVAQSQALVAQARDLCRDLGAVRQRGRGDAATAS